MSHNPTMPVGDGPATEHEQEDAFATVSLNAAANSRVRNETYLNTYFTLLNNTMFPLLDEKAFYDELKRYEADPSIEVPMSWNLRYAAALSVGSMIYGDVEYAQCQQRVSNMHHSYCTHERFLIIIYLVLFVSVFCQPLVMLLVMLRVNCLINPILMSYAVCLYWHFTA